jgi:predicted TIM-barrel fold metal-dependent hydrolase
MRYLTLTVILFIAPVQLSAQKRLPIIDMHLHANSFDVGRGARVCTNEQKIVFPGWDPKEPIVFEKLMRCPSPLQSASTNEAVMRESFALLERYNIWAVTSGPLERVKAWRAASPKRIVPAVSFASHSHTPAELRRLVAEGSVAVFAEIGAQYRGLSLADESYDAYFALAEELDIPVGVHLGEGPPGGAHMLGESTPSPYRAGLTSPLQLETVLIRHPKLRVYVMHYASPLIDEMIALLFSHPQVYVDIACNNWAFPREHFYGQLKRLIDAGFEERIMWGSDQMIWPKVIETAIKTIEDAPFLSRKQKRDIFYNNAARFLRLSSEEIAKHRGR